MPIITVVTKCDTLQLQSISVALRVMQREAAARADINEAFLLHGIPKHTLNKVLNNGLSDKFSGGQYVCFHTHRGKEEWEERDTHVDGRATFHRVSSDSCVGLQHGLAVW